MQNAGLCYSASMLILKKIIAVSLVLSCVSCAEVQHLDEALTLQAYSQEQDSLAKDVGRRDALTKKLLELVRSGRAADEVKTTAELFRRFGEPVLIKKAIGSAAEDEWLYRYQVKYLSSPKVYVRVNSSGIIQAFRYEEPSGK